MACFTGLDGSKWRFASVSHSIAMTGAMRTTTMGLMDWNHGVGISHVPIWRSHCCSAKRVSDDPACSKALQKKITKTAMMYITPMCIRSVRVSLPSVMIKTGSAMEIA